MVFLLTQMGLAAGEFAVALLPILAALALGLAGAVVGFVVWFLHAIISALPAPEQPQRLAERGRFIKPVSGGGADASIGSGNR